MAVFRAFCRTTHQGKCCCLKRAFRKPPCAWARPQSRHVVRTPRWWTSSRACVKQPKVSFHRLSNCAKVPKNSVSRLSPTCISSKNCAFSPSTQDRRNALQLLHLPSVELVRDTYGPSTVFGVRHGCKIERRQILHTEARLGWHTCASDPLLVVEPHNDLQLSERWNRSDPGLDMPCELHEQKPESKD